MKGFSDDWSIIPEKEKEKNDGRKMKVKLLSGTFEKGCGVLVHTATLNNPCHSSTDCFFHLIVLEDKKTGKPFIEIHNERYYKENLENC